MSGLLPRTAASEGTGVFDQLTVQSLNVTAAAFINSLVASTINVATLVLGAVTVGTINGNPDLELAATNVTINGDDVLTVANMKTITNKTIDVTDNTVIIGNIIGEPNITDVIDQPVRTTDNVQFGSVETVGGVIAGSGVSGGFGNFNTINSEALDNTATVNGVNPLTTDTYLNANVNQSVTTTANVTFNSIASLWAGKQINLHGTGTVNSTTSGNFTPAIMYVLTMIPYCTYMIKIDLLGRVTAGPNIGNGYNQTSTSGVTTDVDGNAVNTNYIYQNAVAANGVPFPPLFIDASGTDLSLTLQPDEFDSIDWAWFITIYMQ